MSAPPVPAAAPVPAPLPVAVPQFETGVGIHVGPGDGSIATYMRLFSEMKVSGYRMDYRWRWVEQQKGVYQIDPVLKNLLVQAPAQGFDPVVVLGMGNAFYDGGGMPISDAAQDAFARYAAYLATQLKGSVTRYEVWNEWNAGAGSLTRTKVILWSTQGS